MILDDSTVARELLAAARSLADRPAADTRGLWPRAAVFLARQSLEVALKTYWSAKAPGVEESSVGSGNSDLFFPEILTKSAC